MKPILAANGFIRLHYPVGGDPILVPVREIEFVKTYDDKGEGSAVCLRGTPTRTWIDVRESIDVVFELIQAAGGEK